MVHYFVETDELPSNTPPPLPLSSNGTAWAASQHVQLKLPLYLASLLIVCHKTTDVSWGEEDSRVRLSLFIISACGSTDRGTGRQKNEFDDDLTTLVHGRKCSAIELTANDFNPHV